LSHGTCSNIHMYINAVVDSVMLCLQQEKFWVRTWSTPFLALSRPTKQDGTLHERPKNWRSIKKHEKWLGIPKRLHYHHPRKTPIWRRKRQTLGQIEKRGKSCLKSTTARESTFRDTDSVVLAFPEATSRLMAVCSWGGVGKMTSMPLK
jgi:hypothetical protein